MKQFYFRRLGLVVLSGVFLVLMMPHMGFCNGWEGGPPEGFNFFGPAIVGKLTITPSAIQDPIDACIDGDQDSYCYLTVIFYDASCRGTSFPSLGNEYPTTHDFDELVADNFEGFQFDTTLFPHMPDKCWPQSNSSQSPVIYDNVINSVTKFENKGGVINADVVILFIVPEKND